MNTKTSSLDRESLLRIGIALLAAVALVVLLSLSKWPQTFESAQQEILVDHPECVDQLEVTSEKVFGITGPYAYSDTWFFLVCEVADVKVRIQKPVQNDPRTIPSW